MKQETILNWLKNEGEHIAASVRVMCRMYIKDDSYTFRITSGFGGGSFCSVHNHDILIHVGIPEWFDSDDPDRKPYIDALGREPNLTDLQAFYKGLAIHEFMHACITRPGNIIDQIANKFPMRTKGVTKYQQDFYRINLKKLIHHWFNCVCDARIENIGKNRYNVAQYFDFLRLIDYMVATTPSESEAWDFGYSLLQLGVIGRLPQFPINKEMKKAIDAIVKSPIKGSSYTKDLLDEFICEPDPTISSRKFAKWFDIKTVHDYVEELIYREIESKSQAAEELAKKLASMPNEVRLSGGSSGSPLPLTLPSIKTASKPLPSNSQESSDKSSKSSNQAGSGSNKQEDEETEQEGSAASKNASEQDESTQDGTSQDQQSDDSDDEVDSSDGNSQNDSCENDENSDDANEEDGDTSTDSQSVEDETESNPEKDSSNHENETGVKDSSPEPNNDSSDSEESNGTSAKPTGGDHKDAEQKSSKNNGDTFDENGDWSRHQSKDGTVTKTDTLSEQDELRKALDRTIADVKKTHIAPKKETPKRRPNKKSASHPKAISKATLNTDTSFIPDKIAPNKVVTAAKPLRSILKRVFCEDQEDDIVGLKAGSLNTKALYRLQQRDLSIFKEHRLPTINEAVYYILWDGSGSMCGTKQSESGFACAVIEEAVKGIYPLKIVNFTTSYEGVIHYRVRDFKDKTRKNAAYSFAAKRSFSGGNKDGFSIREATKELIGRNEANKFLIVLSDGAPSDYSSREAAINDVKDAVAFARDNKIDVTSIFFGNAIEREREEALYHEMYGRSHIISCEPDAIVSHLIAIVKKNIYKY